MRPSEAKSSTSNGSVVRILQIHNSYRSEQPSGEDMVVQQELSVLRGAGHEVSTYSAHSDDIRLMPPYQKAAVPGRVIWSPKDRRGVDRILAGSSTDVIHLHNPFPLISPSFLSAARKHRVPVVMTLHNYRLFCAAGTLLRDGAPCLDCLPRTPLPGLAHACYRDSRAATAPLTASIAVHRGLGTWVKGVTRFIVMSEFAHGIMVRAGIPGEQISVKPHFIPAPKPPRTVPSMGHVLYLGRLSPEKGASVLLRAWRPSMGRLIIAGDGPLRAELEALAAPLGNSVEFVGALDRQTAMDYVASARVLVNPSMAFETFGLSVAEAFAHSVPAVVPNQGVFPELVRAGENGLVFEAGNPRALADALTSILAPGEAERMGAQARAFYLENLAPERNLALLEKIYAESVTAAVSSG